MGVSPAYSYHALVQLSVCPSTTTASLPFWFPLQSLGLEATAPLFVHRFANGVPMLDTNTSSACALVAGVAKAGWRGLGLKLSASRVLPSEGRLRFVISEALTTLKVMKRRQ